MSEAEARANLAKARLEALESANAREVLANAATTEQFDLLLSETYAAYFNKGSAIF